MLYRILTNETAKTVKGLNYGYQGAMLFLRPSRSLCPFAGKCLNVCLNTAGRGRFEKAQAARQRKADYFLSNPAGFVSSVCHDVEALLRLATRKAMVPCLRLNGTSDVAWEKYGIMERFASLQMYDYTKNPFRYDSFLKGNFPKNYHLTFSRTEANESVCLDFLRRNGNVAVVFDKVPSTWKGFNVISGDDHDLRFLDPKGVVVGLKAKGPAKKDTSGFVVRG